MIRRKHLLFGICGLLVATALSLRVSEGVRQNRVVLAVPPAGRVALAWPAPRDYVLQPQVALGEEDRGPRKVVSLAPSVTETLCALGLADRLVGRTQFCLYPPQVAGVRIVGGIMDTNLEMIRDLEPDLVLTTANSAGVNSKLQALGLRHESLPHESLEQVFTAIEQAGVLCDRPQTAGRLVAAIRADLERLRKAARGLRARPERVLVVGGELPVPPAALWVLGPGSCLDALLQAAGHQNAAAEVLKAAHGEIPLERLVVLDPEVILTFPTVMPTPKDMLQAYRVWIDVGQMQAIRHQRVRVVGGPEWLSAGPRIAVELHRIITVLSE